MKKLSASSLVELRRSPLHGQGLFARENLKTRQRLLEYVGRVVSDEECEKIQKRRERLAQKAGAGSVYLFQVSKNKTIDGAVKGNLARYFNHSCRPNCEVYIHQSRVWIRTLKKIKKDEELTYDYGFDPEEAEAHPCRCGAPQCTGYIIAAEHRKDGKILVSS
jgi:SET domain-containing protein